MRRLACFLLLAVLLPSGAAWARGGTLDPRFGHRGRMLWLDGAAVGSSAAMPGGATLLADGNGVVRRVTGAGRPDLRYGAGGTASTGLEYPRLQPVPGGVLVVSTVWQRPPDPLVAELDPIGRHLPAGDALGAAAQATIHGYDEFAWAWPLPSGRLLDVRETVAGRTWAVQPITLEGAGAAVALPVPPSASVEQVVPWGDGALLTSVDWPSSYPAFHLIRVDADGQPVRGWGHGGVAKLSRDPDVVLPWRGGIVLLSAFPNRTVTWLDRRGRLVRLRSISAGWHTTWAAAAVDTAGRLVLASSPTLHDVQLRRLTTSGRLDRHFGRGGVVHLRPPTDALVAHVLPRAHGRLDVLAEAVTPLPPGSYSRDDMYTARGVVMWRLRG